jgi:hypothetical protein
MYFYKIPRLGGLREAGSWGLGAYHTERIYFLKDYALLF